MARPNRMAEIEREYGEPLETLIPRLLNELGSMPLVAAHIGVSFHSLYLWCKANGVEKQVSWVVVDGEAERAS